MRQVWLAIGNPLEAMSEFHRAFSDPSWHTIHISVHDTPNYKEGRTVIPGLAGREFENDIIHKYGRDSNEHLVRVLGEFPRYSEGTFWGREMALAREEQRIISFPHERELPVYAFWDIGDIHTVILFVQFVQRWIHILDHYYDSDGAGLPAAAQHIKQLPYTIEGHWCGPDLWSTNRKSFQTGMETVEVARSLGIRFQPVYRHRFQDGIEAVRTIFNQIKINTNLCGDVITAISQYKKKGNPITSQPGKPAFHDHPVKNWTCHFADALRHLAMVYRHQPISGRMLGRVTPQEAEILAEIGYTTHDDYPIDLEVA